MLDERGTENAKDIFDEIQKEFYMALIKKSNNITHLANHLMISRNTLRKTLQKYNLHI